jgi:cyclic pyranopterin phosphate synthase
MSDTHRLTHLDERGAARMVDVGAKPITRRRAVAEAFVRISPELEKAIRASTLAKGDLPAVARIAGIMAAKRTPELIPLCHGLVLDHADVRVEIQPGRVRIEAEASVEGRTGVEMEALTAAAVAALAVIDMGKAIDRGMVVEGLRLLAKSGGRGGDWRADP